MPDSNQVAAKFWLPYFGKPHIIRYKIYILAILATSAYLFGSAQQKNSYFKGSIDGTPVHFTLNLNDSAYWRFTGVRYNDGGPGANIFIINECGGLGLKRGRVMIGTCFYNQHNHKTPPSPMKSQEFLKLGKHPFSIQPGSIVEATGRLWFLT